MIEELIKEEESGYGPIIISKNKIKKSSKSESPDRLLGLTEYIKIDERIFLKRPTEKGFEIINKYREIKGEKIICSIFFD